jgi:hypothetical protein
MHNETYFCEHAVHVYHTCIENLLALLLPVKIFENHFVCSYP